MCVCHADRQKIKKQHVGLVENVSVSKLIISLLLIGELDGFWETEMHNAAVWLVSVLCLFHSFVSYRSLRFKSLPFKYIQIIECVWCIIIGDITLAKLWFLSDARRGNSNAEVYIHHFTHLIMRDFRGLCIIVRWSPGSPVI